MMKVISYSNQAEDLFEKLKKNLFFDFPFSQHVIFVPNTSVKDWMMKNFCDDDSYKVFFDMKIINFSNFLNFVQNILGLTKEKRFLNFLELNLIIRNKITEHILTNSNEYLDLKKYLFKNNQISEKRLSAISDELTISFLNYAVLGNIQDLNDKREKLWQASLFYEIFYEDNHLLAFRDLNNLEINLFEKYSFHFFSINYIPKLFFDFIHKFLTVFHYVNSPCRFFWEDITSDYERNSLKKYWIKKRASVQKIDELDLYLKERNYFLANMEKVKKKYLSVINNYEDYICFENFEERKGASFLSLFQNDILNLENRNQNNFGFANFDSSFQIHVVNSKFREVQVLHANILKILDDDKKMNLSDIHVIAPNINDYVPYIHMIFNDSENSLSYKIADLSFSKTSHLISGIENLFSLANSYWSKSDIIDLFENPLFQKKFNISNDELITLFDLLEKANISFGLDKEDLSKHFNYPNLLNSLYQKSFEKGLYRIIFGMIYLLKDSFTDKSFAYEYPVYQLDLSNSSVIMDKFIKILSNILEDLKVIEDNIKHSLKEWKLYLKKIISDYFIIENCDLEKAALDACMNFLQDLNKIEFKFETNVYSFETFYDCFIRYINRSKTHFNLNNVQAVYFSSFDLSSIPAKAIFIIGLSSEAIKFNTKNSLDINNFEDELSENDMKRSYFLEAMLAAKNYFILSYPSSENYKIESCSVVQELLFYLDSSYRILKKKPSDCFVTRHSAFAFDKKYFSENSVNFSNVNFLAARAFYNLDKKIKDSNNFENEIEIADEVNINSLRLLGKNPIKFYLTEGLEIYLEEEKKQKEFNFSFLDKFLMNQATISKDIDDVLYNYEKKGEIPIGLYYEVEKEKILKENEIFQDNLTSLDIDKSSFITLEFNSNVEKLIQVEKNYIRLPPMKVKMKNKVINLIGKLENVTNKGILFSADDKLSSMIRVWADILIYFSLEDSFPKQAIFFKSQKVKTFNFLDKNKLLGDYLQYYSISLKKPSFLIKPLIDHILNKDEKALSKAINNLYEDANSSSDIYTKWFLSNYKKPDAKQIIGTWSTHLHLLYKPILEAF